MASAVEIANLALQQLGEPPIISFDDDRKGARVMSLLFDPCRDALLRAHPWNFAMRRALLAEQTPAPAFGFSKRFALPSDYLRLWRLNDGRTEYRIEADGLLTNTDQVELIYTARVTDTARFDPLFVFALAAMLAAEGALNITNSQALEDRARITFREKLQEARSADGMENYADILLGETFLDAFLGDDGEPFRPIAPLAS